jgi:hypothetical protein
MESSIVMAATIALPLDRVNLPLSARRAVRAVVRFLLARRASDQVMIRHTVGAAQPEQAGYPASLV